MQQALYFLCLLLLAVVGVLGNTVKEPSTGQQFPTSASGLTLAGVGVRAKGPIKVYAAAYYVNKNDVVGKCKGLKCKSAADLLKSSKFKDVLVEGSRRVTIKMARTMGADTFSTAFTSSFKPRMNGKDDKALDSLKSILAKGFGDKQIKSGTEVVFDVSAGRWLTASINGKKAGTVTSPAICKAALLVYCDEKVRSYTHTQPLRHARCTIINARTPLTRTN